MDTTVNSAPTILITGATGAIGTELTKTLSAQGTPFRAMIRSLKDAHTLIALEGAEVVEGDFNNPATIAQALTGIDQAFLLTNSSDQAEAQQLTFVAEAKRAGIRHIVKLSQLAASIDSPVRFLRYHAIVEQAIRESDIPFTFLRPNLFMQGLLGFRDSIASQGKFFATIGDAKISLIDIRDIGAVAAKALTESGHEGQIYTLTGPQALTHVEMADSLSAGLGKPVTFIDIPSDAMREALLGAGFPVWQADGLIEDYAHYSRNEAAAVTSDVQDVTGKPPRTFADFARDYAPAFA
ncbi:SDR family oxidoreductase [Spirosoma validum]|uniref:SDR family oxidoreductase n=1 Tax=Spirosoma validum TaxID=2771355 RepID=A0A927B280_9BACT|nr:SDR family oxidoreductase [Spirosoma validum]MBD2753978.1 SDR family oxidoreductase [Spirosoma validum]